MVVVVGGGCVSADGGFLSSFFGGGGAVSVVGGFVLDDGGGPSSVVPVVSVVVVRGVSTFGGRGFGRGGADGYPIIGPPLPGMVIVPAIVPCCVDVAAVPVPTPGSVNAVVVSALVLVIPAVGGGSSPGALIVDEAAFVV